MKKVLGQDMVVGKVYSSKVKELIGTLEIKDEDTDTLWFEANKEEWCVGERGLAPFSLVDMEFYEHDDSDDTSVDN